MRRITLGFLLILASCTGKPGADDPLLSRRSLNLEEFFQGNLVARGQFQDVLGAVRRRFDVTITGDWDGKRLKLIENFVYEDNSTEQRVWSLTKTGPDTWTGTAPGVIGTATGVERGDAFKWRYTIDLPIPDASGQTETLRVTFNDWMWLTGEKRLLNRAYMQRFGVDIGDVIIAFEKP